VKFAEIVITDQQASIARLALDTMLADEERFVMTDEERVDFERLAVFMGQVAASPDAFPVTGKNAARIRSIVRRTKGPSQTPRKPKRHARLEQRQSRQKFLRKHRRELAEQYNVARQQMEDEMREADELIRAAEERIASQPKFSIKDVQGNVVLHDIPAEAILREDGEPAFPQIIVPGA
jgi:hypothetical protein